MILKSLPLDLPFNLGQSALSTSAVFPSRVGAAPKRGVARHYLPSAAGGRRRRKGLRMLRVGPRALPPQPPSDGGECVGLWEVWFSSHWITGALPA